MTVLTTALAILAALACARAFNSVASMGRQILSTPTLSTTTLSRYNKNNLQMNFFGDAFRFFSNMNKEASAKHILMKGPDAAQKLKEVKEELLKAEDLNAAFSDMAAKISECPSAARGGNLGTFKPGMMVKEFDEIVFGDKVGVVHGPVQTQFGSHLILITRRYEGEGDKEAAV
jgi:peptidyl-prolyl cis-trans isomerase C